MNSIENLQWRYAVKKFDEHKFLSEEQINILMIYKVFYFLSTNKQTNYLFLFFRIKNIISATLRILTV